MQLCSQSNEEMAIWVDYIYIRAKVHFTKERAYFIKGALPFLSLLKITHFLKFQIKTKAATLELYQTYPNTVTRKNI